MRREPSIPFHHWTFPDVDSLLRQGPPRGLFLIAALVFAILGVGLAAQALYLRRGSIKTLARNLVKVAWLVPIFGVLVIYGLWLVRHTRRGPTRPVMTSFKAVPVSNSWTNDLVFREVAPLEVETAVTAAKARADRQMETNELSETQASALPAEPLAPELPSPPESAQPPQKPTQPLTESSIETSASPVAKSPAAEGGIVLKPDQPAMSASKLPDWISSESGDVGPDRRLVVVASALAATTQMAEADAIERAVQKVTEDFDDYHPDARGWRPPDHLVRSQAVRRVHVERIDRKTISSGVPFHVYRAYYQVELSASVRDACFPIWREQIVGRRISALGGLAGLLTLTFGTLATYFRLDDRTSGMYRRRLKLAAVSIITAGGFAAGMLL